MESENSAKKKPKKRVQFRNVVTEPEVDGQADDGDSDEDSDSQPVSREDTMVEHSVVINHESSPRIEEADYLQALQSVKFDECAIISEPA